MTFVIFIIIIGKYFERVILFSLIVIGKISTTKVIRIV